MKKLALVLLASITFQAAYAAPAVIDTPEATIYVSRPADQWSPNRDQMRAYIKGLDAKKSFVVGFFENGKRIDIRAAEDGWLKELVNAMEAKGWDTTGRPFDPLYVKPIVRTTPEDVQRYLSAQKELYKASIYKSGDPEQAQASSDVATVLGGLLSVATAVVGVKTMGMTAGSNAVIGSGIAGDMSKLPSALSNTISLCWPADPVFKGISTVDVVKITDQTGAIQGQILIAYKQPPTESTATSAVVTGMLSAMGTDTTLQDVEKARLEDFNRRKTIWNECVASGKCAVETINTNNQESR